MTTLTVSTLKLNALFSAIDITRPTGMSIDTLGLFISIDNPVMRQPAAESLEIKTLNVYGYLQNIVLSVDGTHSDALTIDALELECDIDTVTLKNRGDRLRIIQPLDLLLTLPYDSITFEISEPNTLSLRPLGKSDINAKINSVLLIVDAEKKRIADEIAKRIAAILEDTDDDIDVESPDDPNFDPFQVKLNGSDLLTLTEGDDLPLNPSVDEIGEIAKRKYNQNLSLVSRILGNKVVWVDYDPSKRQLQFEFKPGDVPTNTLKIDYGRSKNKKQLPLETIQEGDDGHIIQTDFNAVTEANKNALKKRAELDAIDRKINQIKLYKEALTKEIAMLDAYCPSSISARAWCVAYNEDLSGETKIIEVDYAIERDLLTDQIRNDTGFWIPATQEQTVPTPADTILQHPSATSEHAAWFNIAMLPGAQRDQPLYRVGTIISVDESSNTCIVDLDGQSTLSEHRSRYLPNQPIHPDQDPASVTCGIYYPPCNAKAFNVNDRVIVEDGNLVIGFYSHPVKCQPSTQFSGFGLYFWPVFPNIVADSTFGRHHAWDGEAEINFVSARNQSAFSGVIAQYKHNYGVQLEGDDYADIYALPVTSHAIPDGSIAFKLIILVNIWNASLRKYDSYKLTEGIEYCEVMTGPLTVTVDGNLISCAPRSGRLNIYWKLNANWGPGGDPTITTYSYRQQSYMYPFFSRTYIEGAEKVMGSIAYTPA